MSYVLRRLRRAQRLTQADVVARLADRHVRVTQGYLSLIESGRRSPSVALLRELLTVYRATPEDCSAVLLAPVSVARGAA